MQSQPQAAEFDIEEARRVLGDVIAPWVQDLGLSIGSIECAPPPGAAPDWQPGAMLRMAFSERLCRSGGIVCGQALMALADTSMVIADYGSQSRLPADDDGRSNHAFHASCDRLGRIGRCAGGPARAHHEFWAGHAVQRRRQQAGGDGDKRVCDAVKPRRGRGNLSSRADDRRFRVTLVAPWSGSASASPARASDARRAAARRPPPLRAKGPVASSGCPRLLVRS